MCGLTGHDGIRQPAGFSLVEALVATTILAGALVSLAQLFVVSTTNNTRARTATFAVILAEQKMEQLRGLAWGFDRMGLALSDGSTNTAAAVQVPTGGTGLRPSPDGALTQNTDGYVDYVDRFGNILGGGTTPPVGTVYVRRWSIRPSIASPLETIALRVVVTQSGQSAAEARLASVRTRKGL